MDNVNMEVYNKKLLQAEDYLRNGEHNKAYDLFTDLFYVNDKDVRVLKGIFLSRCFDFNLKKVKGYHGTNFKKLDLYFHRYKDVETDEALLHELETKYLELKKKNDKELLFAVLFIFGFAVILFSLLYLYMMSL